MRSFWLLIGFLLMFSFPAGPITVSPLGGFILILYAVLRMEKLEKSFSKVRRVLFAAIPIAAALLALQIYGHVAPDTLGAWYDPVYLAVRCACEIAECTTMFFFYVGIKIIGRNAEVPQLEKQSSRNMTLMFVYVVSFLFVTLMRFFVPDSFNGFDVVLVYPFVLGYIWRAFNIWTAFTLLTKISVSKSSN